MHPHFLWSCQRKWAVHGPKEKRRRAEFSPLGENLAENGGVAIGAVGIGGFYRVRRWP